MNRILIVSGLVAVAIATSLAPAFAGRQRRGELFEQLNLTPEQQTEVEALRAEHQEQRQDILTPEQQAIAEAALTEGRSPREFVSELDLSDEQRQQLQELRQASREDFRAILTPEQQAQFDELHSRRRGRRF
ncbi:Spy/CpxP family protein refolding chaperone [Synechococcus sp. PCC 7336]|uniref:Spy/CpxP family protein refolding chaperone n=1 Tax=Synechococcus sp. PCC 7336 TaxID=195250 RepID=UPI00034A7F8F|nr:hypothetical protein [Synechococcus sp. PCC 7336]